MERYGRKNLKNIQALVEKETGTTLAPDRPQSGYRIRRMALLAGSLLCFAVLCAFAYAKFSFNEEAAFGAAYRGDGKFEIIIINDSDRELRLQNKVKVMQWSTGEEVEGDSKKIRMEVRTIAPHSSGSVLVDLSDGYDIDAMKEKLSEGDWYYFVLTNENFAFGYHWMCDFDFETEEAEDLEQRMLAQWKEREERNAEREAAEQQYGTGTLMKPEWVWPTVSRMVSSLYGENGNGTFSDHINIAGNPGDEVYAAADGVAAETGFDSVSGKYIVLDLGDGITVRYGHLKEIKVSGGDEVRQGQVIATLGKTGTATGYNLLFEVTVDGESVNPLAEE